MFVCLVREKARFFSKCQFGFQLNSSCTRYLLIARDLYEVFNANPTLKMGISGSALKLIETISTLNHAYLFFTLNRFVSCKFVN